ncbi:MAG: hypothetical protein ACK50J_23855, partial [Planctomyces sp.]
TDAVNSSSVPILAPITESSATSTSFTTLISLFPKMHLRWQTSCHDVRLRYSVAPDRSVTL